MANLNKVMIIGNLGKDPEVRHTQDGKAVASFTVATTDKWKDKQTGQQREKTEWHRVIAFNRLAEICDEYLHKGKQVYVEGRLRTRSWEKDGITRYTTEIEAVTIQMLGNQESGHHQNQSYNQNHGQSGGYQQPSDDDIPF